MSRDEHRAACIEAIMTCMGWKDSLGERQMAQSILDSLHGIARVVEPPKFDLAEVARMLRAILRNGEVRDYDDEIANRLDEAAEFCESAAGDLTNPPEGKL